MRSLDNEKVFSKNSNFDLDLRPRELVKDIIIPHIWVK